MTSQGEDGAGRIVERGSVRLYLLALNLTLLGALLGYSLGVTSPIISVASHGGKGNTTSDPCAACPHCLNCEMNMTTVETATFVSILPLAGTAGALVGGPAIDALGRSSGAVIIALLQALGWGTMVAVSYFHAWHAGKRFDADLLSQLPNCFPCHWRGAQRQGPIRCQQLI